MLKFCGKPLTEDELLEKTLSTIPVSAIVISKQFRTEVNAGRITRFNELINILSVSEKYDNILVKNYNSRPIGTKSVREANYNAPKKGRKQQNPNNKGQERRTGPYNHPNKERNRNFKADTRGGNFTRGGNSTRGNFTRGGNSTRGRGGNHNDVCHRCGSIEHWFKQCHASTKLAASYKEYRQNREQESNLAENEDSEDVNLTIEDFKAEQMHEDAADFD
ncbi:uncharacterized protein LOC112185158 [Rosa chinensis]|uniref:uncharacterized protein LOC112185158 n=1 Tax=Rosa chinensis TaxID=74649 RepID=UPI000D08BD8D|nr:uncharacterized protein LOC112185158 [Rosa chinensis]